MQWGLRRCAEGASACCVFRPLLAAACVLVLAGCGLDGQPSLTAEQPRGATVAFESIDGPPHAQFHALVQKLNEQARNHRLAIVARARPAAYRVRGYLAAETDKGKTTVSWVWDVFDRDEHRALRIAGAEAAKGPHRGWDAADDAMLQRIASNSMARLATFLTSPAAVPAAPAQVVLLGDRDATPEEAGIFRIFKPRADPVPAKSAAAPAATPENAGPVPLPPSRPPNPAAVSSSKTIVLAVVGSAQH
jgi:hypothetical protein